MGDPIRAIFPCKTQGCEFKVARTSKTGLCWGCNDREYRNRKKLTKASQKPISVSRSTSLPRRQEMKGHFQYENPNNGMVAEVQWEKSGDTFYMSTVTFRNGEVYRSKGVQSKDFDRISDTLNATVTNLIQQGFVPMESI